MRPPGRTTRVISPTPLAGSGTKWITSAMTAASNRSASKGNTMASPLQKHRARCPRPSAREGELGLRRIDSLRFGRCAALDELLGKSPVAAAHVDPPLAHSGRQPIEKDLPHELAPGAHHALVGCSIIEPNGLLGHWRRLPLITGFTAERHCSERGGAPGTTRRLGGRDSLGSV